MNPINYDLDKEYRQRQMKRSEKVRQIDEVDNRPTISEQLMQANLISAFLVIVSIIALIVFFFSASPSQAQTVLDGGESGGASGSEVHMYLYSAVVAVQNDELAHASDLMDEALAVVPNFAAAYITQSFIALAQDDAETALLTAEVALEITPNDAAVYFVLAEAQFALENYAEAQATYETYLEMVEDNGYQPILITSLLNDDSLPIVEAHLATCNEESVI